MTPYFIRQHQEDRIFAQWSDIQQRLAFANDIPEMSEFIHRQDPSVDQMSDHRIMIIAHENGPKFVVPWRICVKWKVCTLLCNVSDDVAIND